MEKIIGQGKIVKQLDNIFKIFIASEGNIKPHFILTGASGSGKSYIIKTLAKNYNLNFLDINTAQITKEGLSGNSLSKVLMPLKNYSNNLVVCFCDEFDKLFTIGDSSALVNESSIGVQNEFLKILESGKANVYSDYGKYINIDTSKVLFVFAGAFNGEEKIDIDKLKEYKIKTEFLGRVGLIYNLDQLSLNDLIKILKSSPLLEEYLTVFTEVNKEQVIADITKYLKSYYIRNDFGARIINNLIHKWFVQGGKLETLTIEEVIEEKKKVLTLE